MVRRIVTNVLLVCISFLLALVLLEIVVRVGGQADSDGQFAFMGYTLEPYVLPLETLRGNVEGYLANENVANVIYDDTLGWTFRPNSIRQAGTFTINSAGIRSKRDYSMLPPPDTLRIALFGDSFTAGDDVSDDEVWGRQLEILLNESGIRAEVLNFGVGAYGMGQAFLRWKKLGKSFAPDIVIFGLQPENLKRNLNVFRQLMHASGPPFSKPRFNLVNQELELVNSPTLPPAQLVAAFADFGNHPLAPYEFYYRSRYVASNWWASSRLAGFVHEVLKREDDSVDLYGPDSEGGMLGKAIVDAFGKDVIEEDAVFLVLHLPLRSHLVRRYNFIDPPYKFLLDHSSATYHYIATEEHFTPSHVDDVFWTQTFHYGPEINALVGQVVAERIETCVRDSSCDLPRFPDLSVIYATEQSATD